MPDRGTTRVDDRCRVAVVGGGPAGCAAALELARRGVDDVVLVEAGRYEEVRVGESVPPDTRVLLARLGVLEEFLGEGHDACYGSRSSWGSGEMGHNDFLFNAHGHGWHLDRRRFDALLARAAARRATLLAGTRVLGVEPDGDRLRLALRGPGGRRRSLVAELAVDATGFRAVVARGMGAQKLYLDRLICVYGFFDLPAGSGLSQLTLLEAVEYGWWYAARLPGGRLAVAVAGDGETVRERGLGRRPGWSAALAATRHLAAALDGARFVAGSLRAWPAHSFVLDRPAGDRWLAAGDAASSFDPISSQGIYKALSGGIAAGEALDRRLDGDPGAFDGHARAVREGFAGYAANRGYFYGLERRWPDSGFWRRRRGARVRAASSPPSGPALPQPAQPAHRP